MIKKDTRITIENQQNDFSYKKNKSNLNINFNRISFIFFIFFFIFLIYSIHLIHLGSRKAKLEDIKGINQISNKLYRADIVDRSQKYLAKTVSSIDIGISPSKIIDEEKLLLNLRYIFPDKDYTKIRKRIKDDKFFYFEKKISQENYEKLMEIGDKSIESRDNLIRIYPQKNLFSHIIGQIDNDNNGISGLEKSFDQNLKKTKRFVQLTVDRDIQYLIRNELTKFNKIFNTKGSAAILMNVNNGEILSLVSLPDFDPNKREKITDVNFINRVTKGVYEFGSVFKTFTLAAAFNEKIIEPKTEFVNLPKSLTCAGFPIREYNEKLPTNLTSEEILIRSGNIGSVKIAQEIGEEKYKSFLSKLGILEKINFDIEEIGKPIKFNWGKCPLATASFGHGITTTLLQVVKAYSIIVNGGFDIKPVLIKSKKKMKEKKLLMRKCLKKFYQF